ncbi:MAG: VCBS repeat-containing protein [Acidobacteria bacterium]|nr:VCBS repeat-containing protein [Acidobacteriota bacterium]
MIRKVCFAWFFLTFAATVSAQGQNIFFEPPTISPANGVSLGAAVADFNGDGKIDVVYPDGTIFLAQSNGTYQTGTPWCTSSQPYCGSNSVTTADLNKDGKPDLVITTSNFLWVLLGKGDGTFQAAVSSTTGAASAAPFVADLNGDGKPDVFLFPTGSGATVVCLGKGDGTFQAPTAGPALQGQFIGIADLNGDGKLDVLANGNQITPIQLQVFAGHGDGTFATSPIVTTTTIDNSQNNLFAYNLVDLNGDGKADLVFSQTHFQNGLGGPCCGPGSTFVLLGNGDGTFGTANTITSRAGYISTGDLNKDGVVDLVVAEFGSVSQGEGGYVDVFLGKGDGTFSLKASYLGNLTGSERPFVGDINHDGNADVLEGGLFLFGNGDGTLKGNAASFETLIDASPLLADFNQDGKLDFAYGTNGSPATVQIALGDGTGRFAPASAPINIPIGSIVDMRALDLNGDKKTDLLVTTNPSPGSSGLTVYFLAGAGDGTFAAPVQVAQISQFNLFAIAVADLNNDQKPDLIIGDSSGAINVFLGKGDGTFSTLSGFFGGSASGESLVAGDFNGDGKQDLVVGIGSGLNFLPGKGDGTFGTPVSATTAMGGASLAADFNGDGILDVYAAGVIGLGNGDGTFHAGPPSNLNQNAVNQGSVVYTSAIDINGDGKLDLVGGNGQQPFTDQYALGNGDGSFAAPVILESVNVSHFNAGIPLVGDVNGDGREDIVLALSDGAVSLLNILPPAGPDFSETVTSPSSSTVGKGQSATFSFTVAPMGGFQQTVDFTCSGAPANSTCTVSPTSAMVSGSTPVPITVTVATTAGSSAPPLTYRTPAGNPMLLLTRLALVLFAAVILATFAVKGSSARLHWLPAFTAGVVFVATSMFLASCGGGGSSSTGSQSTSGTATGSYSIKVTGTSGSGAAAVSHSLTFTLVVQ